jgi:hypothetical protein
VINLANDMALDKTKICFSLEKSRTFYRLQEIKAGINRTQKKGQDS